MHGEDNSDVVKNNSGKEGQMPLGIRITCNALDCIKRLIIMKIRNSSVKTENAVINIDNWAWTWNAVINNDKQGMDLEIYILTKFKSKARLQICFYSSMPIYFIKAAKPIFIKINHLARK